MHTIILYYKTNSRINRLKMSVISRTKKIGNLLFLSGMTGKGETKEALFRDTFERIKEVLENNGLTMNDVVSATVWLEDINDRAAYMNDLWKEYFPENPPTRTTVEVGLGGAQIEITATAVFPN